MYETGVRNIFLHRRLLLNIQAVSVILLNPDGGTQNKFERNVTRIWFPPPSARIRVANVNPLSWESSYIHLH